jgi:hypothetical protein
MPAAELQPWLRTRDNTRSRGGLRVV